MTSTASATPTRATITLQPEYATIPDWKAISGMGNTVIYEALSRGDLRAIKVGKRTLIDVRAGLEWLRARPAAQIRMGGRRGAPQ